MLKCSISYMVNFIRDQSAGYECTHNYLYLNLRYEAPVGRPILN